MNYLEKSQLWKNFVDLDPALKAELDAMDDKELKEGRLCDLAPTMLQLMGIEKPAEMTGESLIK